MNTSMLIALADNAEMLLVLSVIYEVSFLFMRRHTRIRSYLNGIMIGVIGILIMARPFVMAPGLVFDTRTILISVTALTFGTIPTAIVVLMTSVYRILSGGIGTIPGLATILTSAAIGLIARSRIIKKHREHRWMRIYGFGMMVNATMLACMLLLPYPTNLDTIRQLLLPVLLIYPVVTVLLAILLVQQKERNESLLQAAEAEARYRSLFENNHASMMIIDPDSGRIIDANPAAVKFYGWPLSKMKKMNIDEINTLSPDALKAELQNSVQEKRSYSLFEHRRADGSCIPVEVYSGPITINSQKMLYCIVHDISERRRLEREKAYYEAQLRQQQKLEAIGTLAGGVAHEINNPIFGIMNYAQLVLDDSPPDSANTVYLKGIIDESKRVSDIVKGLLQFSRQDKQSHSYARVDDIINQTVSLMRTLIRKDSIDLRLSIPETLPDIKCRSQQIQQVLMNLLTNARDALNEKYPEFHEDKVIILRCEAYEKAVRRTGFPENRAAAIAVATASSESEAQAAANAVWMETQRWIRIDVEDHGIGIPEDVRQKMFEPFFSTKPKEKGTGLGLSISFGIIQDHHGFLEVESKQGQFTIMHLHLPVDNGWEDGARHLFGISPESD